MAKQFAWSYSALTGFETCPKQHYHLRVAKDIREAPGPALLEGNRVHEALEKRLALGRRLPGNLQQHEKLCSRLESTSGKLSTEVKLALNRDLEPTEFFAPDVWVRGVFDVIVTKGTRAKVFDYKTGKRRPDSDQLMLFAGITFAAYKEVERVDTAFLWLLSREVDKDTYTRSEDEHIIWREFEPRVKEMETAYKEKHFPARPSGLCKGWCPVRTCEHWEPRAEK
jgi:hypothetical protein